MLSISQEVIQRLNRVAHTQHNSSILFRYQFHLLAVRGIYFSKTNLLLIGLPDHNLAWAIDLFNGRISEHIPKEVYDVISAVLKQDNKFTNRPFFERLVATISDAALESNSVSNEEIIAELSNTKTADRKYDEHGERPFFNHWRRVRASKLGLDKIQRYFGRNVRNECFKNRVTAVWSDRPTSDALIFLDPEKVIGQISDTVAVHEPKK